MPRVCYLWHEEKYSNVAFSHTIFRVVVVFFLSSLLRRTVLFHITFMFLSNSFLVTVLQYNLCLRCYSVREYVLVLHVYIFPGTLCTKNKEYFRRRRFFPRNFEFLCLTTSWCTYVHVHILFLFLVFFSGTTAVCLIAIFSTLRCIYGWKPVHKRMREEKGTS